MNEDTKQFIIDPAFDKVYNELSSKHKPIKPEWPIETLQEIGKIIVQFQRTEATVHQFIGMLLHISDNQNLTSILTDKMSFKDSLWILLNIAKNKKFYRVDDLEIVVVKAYKAEDIRNQIVHSIWNSGPRLKKIKGKQGIRYTVECYDSGELTKLANQIDRIDTSISALMIKYIEWCHENGLALPGVRHIE